MEKGESVFKKKRNWIRWKDVGRRTGQQFDGGEGY